MKTRNILYVLVSIIALLLSSLACQAAAGDAPDTDAPAAQQGSGSESASSSEVTNEKPQPTEAPVRETLRQWGAGANASSQFGDTDWSPIQAAGAPDTEGCEDAPSAWASSWGSGEEWLEVYYETAVEPSEINIYQTYGATQVTKVELLDANGDYHEVYSGSPAETECPIVLTVSVDEAEYEAVAVKIWFDESFLNYWNEIDAVELVGLSTGKIVATPAALFATPTPFPPPDGLLWRKGGEGNPSGTPFWVPQGVYATVEGLVYVADYKGVIVLDEQGNQRNVINSSDLNNIADVTVGPDGNVYVAAWGSHNIQVFTPGGEFLRGWGSEGTGPGAFGTFSPQVMNFGPDGNLYVLDSNENTAGDAIDRVQVFDQNGKYLRDFILTEDFFAPDDLAFGPDGNLYILSGFADYILVLKPDGTRIGQIGDEALSFGSWRAFAIDADGNFYVAGNKVVKLDPLGNLLGEFGVEITDGQREWPDGGFFSSMGVGVTPDGQMVFVSDHSGKYAYLTAFSFK